MEGDYNIQLEKWQKLKLKRSNFKWRHQENLA